MTFNQYYLHENVGSVVPIDTLSVKIKPNKRTIQVSAVHGSFRQDAQDAPVIHAGSYAQMLDRVVQIAYDRYRLRKLDPNMPIQLFIFEYVVDTSVAYPEVMIEDPEYDHNYAETQKTDAPVIFYHNMLEGDKTLSVMIRDKNTVVAKPPKKLDFFSDEVQQLIKQKNSSRVTQRMYSSMRQAYLNFHNSSK